MSSVYVVCWIFLQTFQTYFFIQSNSVGPDQTACRGAVWSGSTLFAEMTFKNHKQMTKQTTIVVIVSLRVNFWWAQNFFSSVWWMSGSCSWLLITNSRVGIPLEVEISSWLYGASLHRAFHYRPSILSIWLTLCWKGCKTPNHHHLNFVFALYRNKTRGRIKRRKRKWMHLWKEFYGWTLLNGTWFS